MRSGKQSFRPRRIVQRTCFACRGVRPKRELVRIVRTPQGSVELDPTGKEPGRGAYICKMRGCWQSGLDKGRLAHTLKVQTTSQDVERLWQAARRLGLAAEVISA